MPRRPFFRKIIIPWYDGTIMNICQLILAFITALFSLTGITVALHTPAFQRDVWIPVLLFLLASSILVSTSARLIGRYVIREKDS
ncbi:MAG: hypothetical protein CSA22_09755 [Deltaproteobacteria bacterium]|nr:MAG: hypothetical protein CSA22_09755 [Deltaproteobacteria bacterium]